MTDAEPFDRAARRRRRDRAAARFAEHDFLKAAMLDELVDRMGDVNRRFERVLDLGSHGDALSARLPGSLVVSADASLAFARAAPLGVVCDEDRLPFADGSFDLVVSAGSLHGVNDLPGALVQVRRALKPDGLFLAAFPAGDTLSPLRRAFLEAEGELRGGVTPRVSPMVDTAQAAGLLQRAGFAMPVADIDTRMVRYPNLFRLMADLRGMGEASYLSARGRGGLRRDVLAAAAERFQEAADADGRVAVPVQIVHLAGWAPAPGQPQPLKPGSATTSLAAALGRRLG